MNVSGKSCGCVEVEVNGVDLHSSRKTVTIPVGASEVVMAIGGPFSEGTERAHATLHFVARDGAEQAVDLSIEQPLVASYVSKPPFLHFRARDLDEPRVVKECVIEVRRRADEHRTNATIDAPNAVDVPEGCSFSVVGAANSSREGDLEIFKWRYRLVANVPEFFKEKGAANARITLDVSLDEEGVRHEHLRIPIVIDYH
jgi:hypothetical protein